MQMKLGWHNVLLVKGGIYYMSKSYDLIVIGAGPGGYVAAIRGALVKMLQSLKKIMLEARA